MVVLEEGGDCEVETSDDTDYSQLDLPPLPPRLPAAAQPLGYSAYHVQEKDTHYAVYTENDPNQLFLYPLFYKHYPNHPTSSEQEQKSGGGEVSTILCGSILLR